MRCSLIRIYLKEYQGGNLAPELMAQITDHLATCDDCVGELAFLQSYLHCTTKIPVRKAPSQFAAKVEQKLSKTKPPATMADGFFVAIFHRLPVTALASILLILTLIFVANHPLQLSPEKRGQKLTPGPRSQYSVKTDSKAAAGKAAPSNPSAGGVKPGAESIQSVMNAASRVDTEINPLPVLTLTMKLPVSGNKKGAEPMAAPKKASELSKNTAGGTDLKITPETAPETTGSSQNAVIDQAAVTPVIDHLRKIIIKLGGKWAVSTVNPGVKPIPELTFTLPARNYQNFLASLEQYGTVQQPYPSIDLEGQKMITIKLEIVVQ
jgi:hypothetical protein